MLQYVVAVADSMKLKGLKKRLNSEALKQYKQGITVNTEVLGDDRAFYERVIEAGREGIIEL